MAPQSERLPRGLRNNNPLNIRISGVAWRGKRPLSENTDGAFEQFDTLRNGIRAALINIKTYINKYHCNTPSLIIRRWAPASDGNNTEAYIAKVTRVTNIARTQVIDFRNRKQVCRLVYGMICVECGQAIDLTEILAAYDAI